MKYVKMLGLAAVAAMALMAFVGAGSASATVLCKTPLTSGCAASGWDLKSGDTIHATQTPGTTAILETTGGAELDTCTGSTVHGEVKTTGSSTTTAGGDIKTLTWGTCTRTTNTLAVGNLEVHHIAGTDNGTLTGTGGIEVTIDTVFGTCVYGTGLALDIGKITGGTQAVIHTEGAVVPKISGNFACPADGVWNATFTVTTPHALYVSAS